MDYVIPGVYRISVPGSGITEQSEDIGVVLSRYDTLSRKFGKDSVRINLNGVTMSSEDLRKINSDYIKHR